ncbi:MAG: DUF3500 domain-containing protein [Chitinophagaceae bacterium]
MKFKTLLLVMTPLSFLTAYSFFKKEPSNSKKAIDFINSLNTSQKEKALFPFYHLSPHEWSFLPASTSYPDGVAMKDLDTVQKQKLNILLQAYLSTNGYTRTKNIMDLEYILKELQPNNTSRIPENYYIAIYGYPHQDSTWGWSFLGHHVALNFTVVKDKIAFAPFFFGANPVEIKEGSKKGTRVIKEEEDIAFELINTFTPEQMNKALIQSEPYTEIVTSNSTLVAPLPDAGISMKELTAGQNAILEKLLAAYLSSMPDDLAAMRLKKIKTEDLNSIHFGWAGSLMKSKPHYYRIQGKTFMVEFDNIQNSANHIHTVWRDFNGDFGRDLLSEHYKYSQHH